MLFGAGMTIKMTSQDSELHKFASQVIGMIVPKTSAEQSSTPQQFLSYQRFIVVVHTLLFKTATQFLSLSVLLLPLERWPTAVNLFRPVLLSVSTFSVVVARHLFH